MSDRFEVPIAGGLDVPLPRMARVRQTFDPTRLDDVAAVVRSEMWRPEIAGLVRRHGFHAVRVVMKSAHHRRIPELVITPRAVFD